MDDLDHLSELGAAMSRMAGLVERADGDEIVPACPGWELRDLAVHLGAVHRWSAAIVLGGQRVGEPSPVVRDPLAEWYAGTATALLTALQAVDPDEPVPNFARVDQRAAFWPRRQLHETTVHAVDAAQALGVDEREWAPTPTIAADGVDEVLRVFFPRMTWLERRPDVRAPIRLTATDTGHAWVVAPDADPTGAPLILPGTPDADSEVRGTAADLYLALWHRTDRDRLSTDGAAGDAFLDGPTTP